MDGLILGGAIRNRSTIYDGSVKGQLERIREAMAAAAFGFATAIAGRV